MQKFCTMLLTLMLFLGGSQLFGQVRYLDENYFSTTVRIDTVPYGQNITVITGSLMMRPLFMDVYTPPPSDTETERPLIIMAATGNFLPKVYNGGPNGTIKDSVVVELATRLTKAGYVVAVIDHRKGWDFTNPDQPTQTATLLQAAYRGIQDMRSAIRFFRRSVAEPVLPPPSTALNPFGIDSSRIAAGGVGTGGYISLGCAYLSDYATEIALFKFTDPNTSIPYVVESVNGNMWGTNYGIHPVSGDTISVPNHVGFNSDISVAFNLGGALGDSVWIDANEPPSINFHVPVDPFAPYDIGVVIVPTTNNVVIDQAAGSYAVARINNRVGNNDVFKNAGFTDTYTQRANMINDGYEGLYPFVRPFTPGSQFTCGGAPVSQVPEGSPWDWWNQARFTAEWNAVFSTGVPYNGTVANCLSLASNVDMSPTKGRTYCDTVMGYLLPRLAVAMNLMPTGIEELKAQSQLQVFPNPANDMLYFRTVANSPIQSVEIFDATGRVVRKVEAINASSHTLDRQHLPTGLYFVKVNLPGGSITERVMFK